MADDIVSRQQKHFIFYIFYVNQICRTFRFTIVLFCILNIYVVRNSTIEFNTSRCPVPASLCSCYRSHCDSHVRDYYYFLFCVFLSSFVWEKCLQPFFPFQLLSCSLKRIMCCFIIINWYRYSSAIRNFAYKLRNELNPFSA